MAVAYYNFIKRRNQNLHRERIFRDIDNPFDYLDDTDIICKYSFQAILVDVHTISRPSVSRIINDFTDCLVRLSPEYVKMPTQNDSVQIMRGFSDIAGFPNVIGAIDGTHIRIKSPSLDEHLYVNRKNYHFINVQAVCDSKLRFMNIVAEWPGSTHDS
nr:putative nuclease HARBI1 [Crassostrea gigas]